MMAIKQDKQRGMTILELMVVLAVATVIALMAVPNLMGMQRRMGLSAEARSLFSAFVQAQSLAATTGEPSRLIVDRLNRTWQVRADTDNDGSREAVLTHELSAPYIEFGPEEGISSDFDAPYNDVPRTYWCSFCDVNEGEIEFDPDGTVSTDDYGSVFLRNNVDAGADVFALIFVGATGNVRLLQVSE